MELHKCCGHGDPLNIPDALKTKWYVPKPVVDKFVILCEDKPILSKDINIPKCKLIFFLISTRTVDIDFGGNFGTPHIPQSDNGREYIASLVTELKVYLSQSEIILY